MAVLPSRLSCETLGLCLEGYGMARRSVFCAALLIIILAASSRQAVAELAFAGAGASQCDLINSNAAPGRGSDQNDVTRYVFNWVQGYMSGFNGYSLMINKGSPFDLGAASPEAQWEGQRAARTLSSGSRRLNTGCHPASRQASAGLYSPISDPRSGSGLRRYFYTKSSIGGHSRSTDVAALPVAKRIC
jgi:hypothetical protein